MKYSKPNICFTSLCCILTAVTVPVGEFKGWGWPCQENGAESLQPIHSPCASGDRPRWTEVLVHACVLSHCSHVRLFATPWTAVHQAPLSMGILQARILEWVAMPTSKGSSQPRDRTHISHISCTGRRVLYHSHHLGLWWWSSLNARADGRVGG